jgi:hypothetical protein
VPAPRLQLLIAPGVLFGSNYAELVTTGFEVSVLTQLPVLDGNLHVGGALALHQSIFRPAGVDDHRAVPLYGAVAWRPGLAFSDQLDLHIGAAAGALLIDVVQAGQEDHAIEFALGGQLELGVGWLIGPGSVDVIARLGTARYIGGTVSNGLVGLPLGASLMATYRFPVL